MSKQTVCIWAALLSVGLFAGSAAAAPITYTNQSTFQSQLGGGFTLVNLDASPLSAFTPPYRVEDSGPAAAFLGLGIDFFAFNAQVLAGQNSQTPTDRDRLIGNGTGFGGQFGINFVDAVNGIGAFSNNVDFGRILAYSGANLGGTFLGQVQFGPGSFGGLTSDVLIGSAQFTCDFNQDRRCGVYDIQFGTFAENASVPEPATLALVGFGLAEVARRRRRGNKSSSSAAAAP